MDTKTLDTMAMGFLILATIIFVFSGLLIIAIGLDTDFSSLPLLDYIQRLSGIIAIAILFVVQAVITKFLSNVC